MRRMSTWLSVCFILLYVHAHVVSQPNTTTSFTVHFTVPPNIGAPVIDVAFSDGFVGSP